MKVPKLKMPPMKKPQVTTGAGIVGIINQLLVIFGKDHWGDVLGKIGEMNIGEQVAVFGPLLFFIWCWVFNENEYHERKNTPKSNEIEKQ